MTAKRWTASTWRSRSGGRVVNGDPAEVEIALLQEQDEIEFTLGADWFERRDAE